MSALDLTGTIVAFLLTCMVLSYIFGDNPLFRFSVHLFIGVAAGFAGAVVLRNVIYPNLILPLFNLVDGDFSTPSLLSLVPILLSLLLLAKLSSRLGRVGNISMAFLVGVGAAVALGGAVTGTLFPQTEAAINQFDLTTLHGDNPADAFLDFLGRFISITGTLATLIYFHFSTRSSERRSNERQSGADAQRSAWLEGIASVGRVFVAVTFGVVFAGVYTAALTAFIERLNALIVYVISILDSLGLS